MLLYYIRHGDPIYSPSTLTPLGKRQAEAVGKRLALHGIDRIYSSPSGRAMETAQPAAALLKKEIVQLDFADEDIAWEHFALRGETGQKRWVSCIPALQRIFCSDEIYRLGESWYEHPDLQCHHFKEALEYYRDRIDDFLLSLGYAHDREGRSYEALTANKERIALFAHGGFGEVFLSTLLHVPYPLWVMRFSMNHTGMTVIDFGDKRGQCFPKLVQFSGDGHLYAERLPTAHCNEIYV